MATFTWLGGKATGGDPNSASAGANSSTTGASDTAQPTPPCFAAGTRIGTLTGETAVESLAAGMRVRLANGGGAEIVWLGHRRVAGCRHPRPRDVQPVRIAAGTFGEGLPLRDLWLSPDHAVFVEGVLVPIRHLVNNTSIIQEVCDSITYWHVELAQHDVILAEGLPCESFLDTGNRSAFANGGTVVQAHPDFARRHWDGAACAPLVVGGPELDQVRKVLRARRRRAASRRRTSEGR